MILSPRSAHEAGLERLNLVATVALSAASFPGFAERLAQADVRLNVTYGDLVLTEGGVDRNAYCTLSDLPCGPILKKSLRAWGVPLDGRGISATVDNFIQLRFAWVRASDFKEDIPNLKCHEGAYLHWASELRLSELIRAVAITFERGLPTASDRGRYFCGVCRNIHNARRRA